MHASATILADLARQLSSRVLPADLDDLVAIVGDSTVTGREMAALASCRTQLTAARKRGEIDATHALAIDRQLAAVMSAHADGPALALSLLRPSTPSDHRRTVIEGDAVHPILDEEQLATRTGRSRDIALLGPSSDGGAIDPEAALFAFVEIAYCCGLDVAIDDLVSGQRRDDDPDTAIFYSINRCQGGLGGVDVPRRLIERVAAHLASYRPEIRTLITLSPIPGLADWLAEHEIEDRDIADPTTVARYLVDGRTERGTLVDPVARFHIGNGARLERIALHLSAPRPILEQSGGWMANYLYEPEHLEHRRASLSEGVVPIGPAVAHLLDAGKTDS